MRHITNTKGIHPSDKVGYAGVAKQIDIVGGEYAFPVTDRGVEVVNLARNCYNALRDVRLRRQRSRRYYRGEQWSDMMEYNGKMITEEEYIQMQGKPALKQNLIRPPVRNLIGQYRSNPFKSVIFARNADKQKEAEMMSVAFESAYEMNDGIERDARMAEEYFISGLPIYETSYSYDISRKRCIPKFRKVDVDRFIVNPDVNDVCGEDVDLIGEICDESPDAAVSAYAHNEMEEAELRNLFDQCRRQYTEKTALTSTNNETLSFDAPDSLDTVRIIKVCVLEGRWLIDAHDYSDGTRTLYEYERKNEIDEENKNRAKLSVENGIDIPKIKYRKKYIREWVYYHLTPQGNILFKKTNPYQHKSHPYVFKMYPLVDGEVWSLVEDLIDQQRAINRMIILQDFVISASAKGVLLMPEEAIPDDMDIEDIADEWTRYNGVIKIKTKNGIQLPKQVIASNFNVGINDAINYQMKWIQDIGGVQNAAMGVQAQSGTSAARYKMETANSSMNALDYIESFGSMLIKRDWKIVQIIKQFYTSRQYIALAGDRYSKEAHMYDPEKIRDIDFDNTMAKVDNNITMRFVSEDSLAKLLEMGLINLKQYLKASETSYSDKLLQDIEDAEKEAASGNISPEVLSQIAAGVQAQTPQSTPTGLNNVRGLFNGSVM